MTEKKFRPPTPPPIICDNKALKKYAISDLLGTGGFAKCYRANDGITDYAVKVVCKAAIKNQKQKQKLLSEIKIHQVLNHPHIVTFRHVFEDDVNVYMILDLCENKSLADMIKMRKRLTCPEVCYYMWQIFDGIRFIHRKGYIHRDIKLGNLFLDSFMKLKIGDFGLATQIEHDGDRKKTICGTPNYIAPEVLFDTENGHSFEVDIWSLGIVMYTLCIGKPPFQTQDIKSIYKKIKENNLIFPPDIPINNECVEIIKALLHSKPECRPSVDDVMEHPFFRDENMPLCIPKSALLNTPCLEVKSSLKRATREKSVEVDDDFISMLEARPVSKKVLSERY
jgi:serine/threonine protein kinase